ncbi:MAG: hypothetical protein M3Z14_00290 [Candidatus Eremiobacteraeota bacterium]|nr:hypothetical protein [Candidatus Eremiobacteraeota bacterium]
MHDFQLRALLLQCVPSLEPYYGALLRSLLTPTTGEGEDGDLRKTFASFVSENPRALEQLCPEIIDGILRQTAVADPSIARLLMVSPANFTRLATGTAGALLAAVTFFAFIHFPIVNRENTAVAPNAAVRSGLDGRPRVNVWIAGNVIPHVRIAAHLPQPSALRIIAHGLKARRLLRSHSAPLVPSLAVSERTSKRLAGVRSAHAIRARTPAFQRMIPALPPVAHPQEVTVARAQAGNSGPYTDTYVVEQTNAEADVPAAPSMAGPPVIYCYVNGSWRTC